MSDANGGRAPPPRPRVLVIKARARGEEFRIVQVQGNLFVCSRANGNCFKDLNGPQHPGLVFDYAEEMLAAGRVLPPPVALADHVYERYVPPPDDRYVPLAESESDPDAIARLDPVCLMDVDPGTAKWAADYGGRTYYFCAPACRRTFLANPASFVPA
jgi:YHS domain-containing protein